MHAVDMIFEHSHGPGHFLTPTPPADWEVFPVATSPPDEANEVDAGEARKTKTARYCWKEEEELERLFQQAAAYTTRTGGAVRPVEVTGDEK